MLQARGVRQAAAARRAGQVAAVLQRRGPHPALQRAAPPRGRAAAPRGGGGGAGAFWSDESPIRHFNGMGGQAAVPPPPGGDGPQASLGRLAQLLAEASRLASAASAQVAAADPGRVAVVLAEAEAARRQI